MTEGSKSGQTSPIRQQWMTREQAVNLYLDYKTAFGEKHTLLACHAVFPLIVNPRIINLIRINFLDDEDVPWIAEPDFLLSGLCQEYEGEMYHVDPVLREVLLTVLVHESPEGTQLLNRLADFLLAHLVSDSGVQQSTAVTQTHKWVAWSYLYPELVVNDMEQLLLAPPNAEGLSESSRQIQVATMLEIVKQPLELSLDRTSYSTLLKTADVLASYWYIGPDILWTEELQEEIDANATNSLLKEVVEGLRESETPLEDAVPDEEETTILSPEEEPVESAPRKPIKKEFQSATGSLDTIFLIAGGGTGAKVIESFIHLCAAGLGPEEAHVLFIDSDTANGNLQRTLALIQSYNAMQVWNWDIKNETRSVFRRSSLISTLTFFNTHISYYVLADPIRTAYKGGIRVLSHEEQSNYLLDLFYDEEEQRATCEEGFASRSNLGSLLLPEHLKERLLERTSDFISALTMANDQAAATGRKVPVVAIASLFGGTGASLVPIIRRCIEQAVNIQFANNNLKHTEWAAINFLPYFMPSDRIGSIVPDRFLVDASSTLQLYGMMHQHLNSVTSYRYTYLLGSDNASRNRVKPTRGRSSQSNPPYFEEFLGALAIMDFVNSDWQSKQQIQRTRVRLFDLPNRAHLNLNWSNLPEIKREGIQMQLGYLLHTAAFYLFPNSGSRSVVSGLYAMLKTPNANALGKQPFFSKLLNKWAKSMPSTAYNSAKNRADRVSMIRERGYFGDHSIESMERVAAEYFARLFLWSDYVLVGESLSLIEYGSSNYGRLISVMDSLKDVDIDLSEDPQEDNALVRLLRGAITSMVKEYTRSSLVRYRGDPFELYGSDGRIHLPLTRGQLEDVLAGHDLNLINIMEEYSRTLEVR